MAGNNTNLGAMKPSRQLGPADAQILIALARFHYLTVKQVVRLFYKPTPANEIGVQRRFKRLTDDGYCLVRWLERQGPSGRGPQLFVLDTKGRNYVESLGIAVPPRFRPSEVPTNSNQLRHVAACSDVFIQAELFCRNDPDFTLERLVHEREFRSVKSYVEVGGQRTAVIPDGWFSLIGQGYRYPRIVEVDLASERQDKWRRKARALAAWIRIDGPHQRRMGVKDVRVAVVAPGRPARAETLRLWTEAELGERHRDTGALFRFTGLDPATTDPATFFRAPVWQDAFGQEPVSLLHEEESAG